MTGTGWEFFGVKFSVFATIIASVVMLLSVLFSTRKSDHLSHVDTMAGDEGED